MLSHLSIQNMAIIESLQLNLEGDMTVLTGETGAGKSIIIDAISLLMGDRASMDLIRHHEDKAQIEGVFEISGNQPLKDRLSQMGISEEGQLIVKRTIKRGNSGQIRANGELLTANQLRELGQLLVDVHVQHDTHRLFLPEYNYQLLDNLAPDGSAHFAGEAYQSALEDFQKSRRAYRDFMKNASDIQKRLDLILFHKEEIEKLDLKIGELEELEERRRLIANSDKLHTAYSRMIHLIKADGGALENLYEVLQATEGMVALDPSLGSAASQIGDVYYGLEEFAGVILDQLGGLSYEPDELEQIDARLSQLQQAKRKYRMELPEIAAYYETILDEIAQVEDSGSYEANLLASLEKAHGALLGAGEELNRVRMGIAASIKSELEQELADLQLFNARFDVEFNRLGTDDMLGGQYPANGIYDIQFLLSTNKGEPLKPLHKVASGGELSRVMLGLKTILNRGQSISTIIFDEIDTGVSGLVASSIGGKMKEIAKTKQVLCITHLPQVASLARHHIHVSKYEKDGRTVTRVSHLDLEERTKEVARMLSSEAITPSALENARQLLSGGI